MKIPTFLRDEVLINEYGKYVLRRFFTWVDGNVKDFVIWGGHTKPVIIFALTADRKLVVARQFRWAANTVILELPGGCMKDGESVETAVRNELREETGYRADAVVSLGEIWFEPANCITPFIPVLATGCTPMGEQSLDEGELIEEFAVPLEEWRGMIRRREVTDSKSIAVTYLALDWFGVNRPDLIG